MASISTHGVKRRQLVHSSEGSQGPVHRPRRRKRRWLLWTTLLGLPILILAAPTIVAKTSLLDSVVALCAKEVKGELTVGSASLNWFQPVELRDIELRDLQNKTVAKIDSVTSSRTLFGLVTNLSDLGNFQIVKPEIDLTFQDKTSNVEDALAPMLQPKPQAVVQKESIGVGLKITEGVVRVADTVGGRQWQIDELDCDVTLPSDAQQALLIAVAGRVTPADPAGHFNVKLSVQPGDPGAGADPKSPAAAWLAGNGELKLAAQVMPLELLEPLLRRFAGGGEISGLADVDYSGHWGRDASGAQQGELVGQATAAKLVMAAPWLGEDRLVLSSIHVPCDVQLSGTRLDIRRCDLQTDVGQLTCTGAIDDISQLSASWFSSLWTTLPHSQGEVKGTIDMARLARLLPNTLRVRNGMQIDEGTINLDLSSGAQNGQWTCTGQLETTRLVASEAGRQITWEHPVAISFSGHDTPQGPIVERLVGDSDFLKFAGAGTPDAFSLNTNFELSRLADELGKFFDLGELRLAGQGTSAIHWQRDANGVFAATADLQATNLALARPGKPAWNDAQLTINAKASGKSDGATIQRVDAATVQVSAAEDQFSATLTAPVANVSAKTVWPVDATLQGELLRWVARIEPWVGLPAGWDIGGQANVISTVNCSADVCEIAKCQADFQSLHVWGSGLYLDEPRLRVTTAGKLNVPDSTLTVQEATLTASDVSARVTNVSLAFGGAPGAQQRVDSATLQCNLGTLYRWTQNPREEANWRMSGLVTAKLSANLADSAPAIDLDVTVDNLEATPRAGQPWREKQVHLVASGKYHEATDTVQLARCDLASEVAQLTAMGRVERWSKDRQLQLSGQTSYDLEKISLLLQPYLGAEVRATGRETHSFSLAGPLASLETPAAAAQAPVAAPGAAPIAAAPPAPASSVDFLRQLTGKADVGWQSASVYGFEVSGGKLDASLAKGVFDVAPAKVAMSGGTLTLATRVTLGPGPVELYLPNGPLIQQAVVSPSMCHQWLMYVLPAMADATEADGKFSVTLTGSQIPLGDPKKADVAGELLVHSVDIGPTPMANE
ncbi:MAG TPA: hypothetical protein VGJ26_09510, partial [Pirellulales bacterium]